MSSKDKHKDKDKKKVKDSKHMQKVQPTLISFDYAIKYLLKNKGEYDVVEGFISALLVSQGYGPVKIKALLESESNRELKELKRSIADVIVEDKEGYKYIIEIDRSYTSLFLNKACFNTSRLIVDSISGDEDYSTIKKVFHINLLYSPPANIKSPLYHGHTIFKETDKEHPVDIHVADISMRIFDAYNIFPEYFVISVPLFNDVVKEEIDEWLYLLKHSKIREDFKSPSMKKVAERLNILRMTYEERTIYEEYRNSSLKERDYIVSVEEKGIEKGKAQGKAEGKAEGIQEGIKTVVINMLKKNKSIADIIDATGLSEEEITKLRGEQ